LICRRSFFRSDALFALVSLIVCAQAFEWPRAGFRMVARIGTKSVGFDLSGSGRPWTALYTQTSKSHAVLKAHNCCIICVELFVESVQVSAKINISSRF